MHQQVAVRIDDSSQIGAVRRAATDMAYRHGFDETRTGKVALLVSEAATNILKHAGGGEILLRALHCRGTAGLEILAIDSGPGIASLDRSMVDGVSTTGTSGTGLGAMQRIADSFSVYSQTDKGTIVYMRLWNSAHAPAGDELEVGVVCIPMPGESACGDAWTVSHNGSSASIMVADGLGHGPDAAAASEAAAAIIEQYPSYTPSQLIETAHLGMRATRGAAVSVSRISPEHETLSYAGVGNIAAVVLQAQGSSRRQLVSHNGIVGSNVRKIQEFSVDWHPGDTLIMHSDGPGSHWSADQYPGLLSHEPAIIAAVLYRDFWRRRDDVTVVVAR